MRAEFIKYVYKYVLNYVVRILKRYMEKLNARWRKTKIIMIISYCYVIARKIILVLNNEIKIIYIEYIKFILNSS